MSANTNIINRIAIHATASSALPTLAAVGSNITVGAWGASGYDTFGGRNSRGDDYDIDEDAVSFFNVTETFVDVSAPLSDGIDDTILISRKLEPIELQLYDIDQAMFAFDSAGDITSSVFTWADPGTATKRAVAVEINGIGLWSFPSCHVSVKSVEGAAVDVVRTVLTIKPINTTELPNGGFNFEKYV